MKNRDDKLAIRELIEPQPDDTSSSWLPFRRRRDPQPSEPQA